MLRASLLADARILPQATRGSYFFNRIGQKQPFMIGCYRLTEFNYSCISLECENLLPVLFHAYHSPAVICRLGI